MNNSLYFSSRIFVPGILGLFLLALSGCTENARPDRPNILFVISDDQSWLHTGISGDPVVQTPSFDKVAKEGLLFNNSFCTSPSCTPSRSSILTGQEIWRLKQAGLLHSSIPPELPLVTHLLSDAGYHARESVELRIVQKWFR